MKKIPIIYDDGINTAHVNMDFDGIIFMWCLPDSDTILSAFDRQGLNGYKEEKPLISNAIVT